MFYSFPFFILFSFATKSKKKIENYDGQFRVKRVKICVVITPFTCPNRANRTISQIAPKRVKLVKNGLVIHNLRSQRRNFGKSGKSEKFVFHFSRVHKFGISKKTPS